MRTKDVLKKQLEEAMVKALPEIDKKVEKIVDTFLHQHIGKILLVALGIDTRWSDWQLSNTSPFVSRIQSMAMQAAEGWIAEQMPGLVEQVTKSKSTVRNHDNRTRVEHLRITYANAFDSAFDDAVRKIMGQYGKVDGEEFANKLIADFMERELSK